MVFDTQQYGTASRTSRSSCALGRLEVASTRILRNLGPERSPMAVTARSVGSSTPPFLATYAMAIVKQEARAASSSSVGAGPVSVPPSPSGSSARSSNLSLATIRQLYPPSQYEVTAIMADDSAGRIQLPEQVAVLNVGLGMFAEAVRAQGAAAVEVDWRIPARGDTQLVAALTRLYGRLNSQVEAANNEVVRRLDKSSPRVLGISPARAVIP